MTFHRRNVSIASSNRTATPTDSWESYFDSWSSEDHEAPDDIPPPSAPAIVEPIIVDNDLYHTESLLSANFNLDHALDFDLDWELDHHYREYQSRCSPNAFGRLNDDNPASKRQAIFMSKLHSPDRVPRGQGQGQGHTDTVRPIHQSRRDRRPAPVRRRVDDVDVRATEMAKPTSQPCVAAEWRGSETETTRSNDAASTLQVRSLVPDQHQRQSTIPSTTSSTAARYGERNPGRSRGPAKAGLGSARPLDPLDPPNLKNFIRHGKQARAADPPRDHPTTNVSTVHAQQQKYHHAISEPASHSQRHNHHDVQPQPGQYTVAAGDNRNVAAQAGAAAAHAAGKNQKIQADIEAIVAEERDKASKMPKYPGLERFILVEKMGDGAFSNVYKARDTHTGDEVAIKVVRKFEMNSNQGDAHLHPNFKKQPKGVERANILKEVQIMRQLDHPNIVKLIDFSESRQYYYIVLELCPGGELFHQIVRLTYFSEDLSRHVITQVAKALLYLHEETGVVHRDIKPENLLFYPVPFIPTRNPRPRGPDDEDKADEGEFVPGVGAGGIGQIKIADFGLSKVIWDSQTMTPCGTVGYTAPEIVKDERYSKSVDMWALGCVLYTLLCGFPPFYDESIQVLTEKVARGQYTFLSPWWDDISKSAQDLVSHLLTVNPDRRYTIEEFLNHPWIRNSAEPTYAAADAPPLATPLHVRQKELVQQANLPAEFLQTPNTPGARRADFRSPGAVNLREVFDVGYAVHRQEEEAKRRKNFKQGYRGAGMPGGLNPLNEDDDDDEDEYEEEVVSSKVPKSQQPADVSSMEAKMRQTNLGSQPSAAAQARSAAAPARSQHHANQQEQKGYGQHSAAVAAAAKQSVGRRNKQPFELSLDNSTLLGRRNKMGGVNPGAPSKLREEISAR